MAFITAAVAAEIARLVDVQIKSFSRKVTVHQATADIHTILTTHGATDPGDTALVRAAMARKPQAVDPPGPTDDAAPMGACYYRHPVEGDKCEQLTENNCAAWGGVWYPGQACMAPELAKTVAAALRAVNLA